MGTLKVETSTAAAGATAATATTCHVVAIPYPGRGHINPMMNLCKLISLRRPDILFTFVVTEEWHSFISSEKKPANIRFNAIPNVIPSEIGRAKDFPAFLQAVATKMESPFELLLDQINAHDSPVNAIVADTYLDWVVRVGNRRNIPVASLWTMSASVFSIFHHFDLLRRNGHFPVQLSERGEELVDYIPGIPATRLLDLPTMLSGTGQKLLQRVVEPASMVSKAQYLLFTSLYEFEDQVIDALKLKFPFPVLTLGPTIPYFELESTNEVDHNVPDYIKWLNSQPKESVLYVSMGSFLSVSSTQMEEIIAGICNSGVRFLWVSRGETTIFKHEYGERGFVVSWCDQLRVLNHPSAGGFWTHCGWNSTLEAVFAGIPILASPIMWDQTHNSKKIVEDWKIGCRVRRGVEGESLVARQQIAKLVQDFMNPEKSDVLEMRKNAKQLKQVCQAAIAKGGSSDTNLDSFIRNISQVHSK